MQYDSKLVPKTIRDIYTYISISLRIRITNVLPAMHKMSGCDSVSTFSHIEKIATFQTIKNKIENVSYDRLRWIFLTLFRKYVCCYFNHSHKKWKDSLEDSLDRVLFAAELEFPKILAPRLPQHASNVNIKCAGKSEWSKQLCSLYLASFLEHWYIIILLFWY